MTGLSVVTHLSSNVVNHHDSHSQAHKSALVAGCFACAAPLASPRFVAITGTQQDG